MTTQHVPIHLLGHALPHCGLEAGHARHWLRPCLTLVQVLDGYKMVVASGPGGSIRTSLQPLTNRQPSWEWDYSQAASGRIRLDLQESSSHRIMSRDPSADLPFSYVI